jgi:hypothetical protein
MRQIFGKPSRRQKENKNVTTDKTEEKKQTLWLLVRKRTADQAATTCQ